MIINTEWGNFGSDGTLNDFRNEFDLQVDKMSTTAGVQMLESTFFDQSQFWSIFVYKILFFIRFEKMTSSIYLSELVRLTIIKCAEMKLLFEGETSELLRRPNALISDFIYEIEGYETTNMILTIAFELS